MLVENATSLVHLCTCACGKPILKIAPMAKLDSPKNHGTPSICPSRIFCIRQLCSQVYISVIFLRRTYLFTSYLLSLLIADKFHYRQNIYACSVCYLWHILLDWFIHRFYSQKGICNQKYHIWPKNDGEKWSRKNYFEIPPCGKIVIFITEFVILGIFLK